METAATRAHADMYHGRGSQYVHLAKEVSHMVMYPDVQARITQRLHDHYDVLFGNGTGAGESGTTGAFLVSGNVGFGRGQSSVAGSLMDLIFPHDAPSSKPDGTSLHEGDAYARRKGGVLSGELLTSGDGVGQPPDVLTYEQLVKDTITRRSDYQYLFGDEGEFVHFQHRLWRYGPNFNAKKGGLWHKDTCPFGVSGAVPHDAVMYTIVYILYIENLDFPTAGTRMKDSDGSWAQLPCVAGEANIIRSGETDMHVGQHSGPLQIKKVDDSKPAYRVMMQSKTLVRPKGGRRRVLPSKGNWRGLRLSPLETTDAATAEGKLAGLKSWLRNASLAITAGIGATNGIDFGPVFVQRATEVTRELGGFMGLGLEGILEPGEAAATPVVIFGFDLRYTEAIVNKLAERHFKYLVVADEKEFEPLREESQDHYSNMETAAVDNAKKVASLLSNSPFDQHFVVDIPPVGTRALPEAGSVLERYGELFKTLAARSKVRCPRLGW